MKYPILTFLLFTLTLSSALGQGRFKSTEGSIDFSSDAPLEVIEASSDNLKGVIDPLSGRFAFSINISSFEGFNSALQKQHFNENYMESGEYPKASFSGKIIEKIDYDSDGNHTVRAKGDLKVHGVTQNRIIKSKIKINGNKIELSSNFLVPLIEHDITIPKIVNQKIATEIDVTISAVLEEEEF
ncbi:MAG: YceI family protein [Bacteroidota bacterium]